MRPQARYERTLDVLARREEHGRHLFTPNPALMLGLGETHDEIVQTLRDLRESGCQRRHHRPVFAAVAVGLSAPRGVRSPGAIRRIRKDRRADGSSAFVASGPFVRSSYNGAGVFRKSCCPNDWRRSASPPVTKRPPPRSIIVSGVQVFRCSGVQGQCKSTHIAFARSGHKPNTRNTRTPEHLNTEHPNT